MGWRWRVWGLRFVLGSSLSLCFLFAMRWAAYAIYSYHHGVQPSHSSQGLWNENFGTLKSPPLHYFSHIFDCRAVKLTNVRYFRSPRVALLKSTMSRKRNFVRIFAVLITWQHRRGSKGHTYSCFSLKYVILIITKEKSTPRDYSLLSHNRDLRYHFACYFQSLTIKMIHLIFSMAVHPEI